LYKRALDIREKTLGPDHVDVAQSLLNLGSLYASQTLPVELYEGAAPVYRGHGLHAEAETLYKRALEIREKVFGPDHEAVAGSLNSLGWLYQLQGRYADAEPLYKGALEIREKVFGPDHADVAGSLMPLAVLYKRQGRYAEAERLDFRALAILEKTLGRDHPRVAALLNNLGNLYSIQNRYADSEHYIKHALELKAFGPDHSAVASSLSSLGLLYQHQGRYGDAEASYKRALEIREKAAFAPDDSEVAGLLNLLIARVSSASTECGCFAHHSSNRIATYGRQEYYSSRPF
jgi:tetratricopeptide (TPR) repeat protein